MPLGEVFWKNASARGYPLSGNHSGEAVNAFWGLWRFSFGIAVQADPSNAAVAGWQRLINFLCCNFTSQAQIQE
jgi:hypothetical protein